MQLSVDLPTKRLWLTHQLSGLRTPEAAAGREHGERLKNVGFTRAIGAVERHYAAIGLDFGMLVGAEMR